MFCSRVPRVGRDCHIGATRKLENAVLIEVCKTSRKKKGKREKKTILIFRDTSRCYPAARGRNDFLREKSLLLFMAGKGRVTLSMAGVLLPGSDAADAGQ